MPGHRALPDDRPTHGTVSCGKCHHLRIAERWAVSGFRERGLTFPDAYCVLLRAGAIIHLDPADDEDPDAPVNAQSS